MRLFKRPSLVLLSHSTFFLAFLFFFFFFFTHRFELSLPANRVLEGGKLQRRAAVEGGAAATDGFGGVFRFTQPVPVPAYLIAVA